MNGIRYLQVDAPPGGANEGFDWFSNQTFQTITGSDDDDDDDDNDISDVGVTISLPPSLIQDKLKGLELLSVSIVIVWKWAFALVSQCNVYSVEMRIEALQHI